MDILNKRKQTKYTDIPQRKQNKTDRYPTLRNKIHRYPTNVNKTKHNDIPPM